MIDNTENIRVIITLFFENAGRYFVKLSHCRASGGMAIFLEVSAAPKRILLSEFSYASVQHSLSQPESFIVLSFVFT